MQPIVSLNSERVGDTALEEEIRDRSDKLYREIDKVIVGEENFKETICLAIMAEGSLIGEGAPGHGKSLGMQTLAKATGLTHKRIEGVNGLMPFDIQGGVDHRTGKLIKGPIFHNLVVFEEINRVEGKTKSALLNPMQDHFVSFTDYPEPVYLPRPHIVVATYNPTERDRSVFDMTTAELDRFMFRVRLKKKTIAEMEEIAVRDASASLSTVESVMSGDDIIRYQAYIRTVSRSVLPSHPMVSYISRLAVYVQDHKRETEEGASPRAVNSVWLALTAFRIVNGLPCLLPEHVEHLIRRCWVHRFIAEPERKNQMLEEAFENVSPIP